MPWALLILGSYAVALTFQVVTIGSALQFPAKAWKASNQDRTVWLLLLIALGPLSAWFYWARVRPKLMETRRVS